MTVPRQLPLEPTVRIDPRTQVDRIPGHDAVCVCRTNDRYGIAATGAYDNCGWPFCGWKDHIEQEDAQ